MKAEKLVQIIAGFFISASTLLGIFYNKNFLFFTIFVGLNLFQYGFTNFCPLKIFLNKLGFKD